MKKRKWMVACSLLFLTVVGCSRNGNDVGPEVDASQVVGTWQITQITADPAVTSPTYGTTTDILKLYQQNIGKDCVGPTRYVFSIDNKLQLTTSTDCQSRMNSLFGFTSATWQTSGRQLRVEGDYDSLIYVVVRQSAQEMVWQRTEYNSPFDGKTHLYTITLAKR
jgi:hypothetical protein